MKICFLTRVDAFDKNGGDTYQLQMYEKHLKEDGHEVSIVTDLSIPAGFDKYILVNLDRPLELVSYYAKLKKKNLESKTSILSIHHSYKAIDFFEKNIRAGKIKIITNLTSDFFQREKIKNFARSTKYISLLLPSIEHVFINYKKTIARIINDVSSLILIAEGEKIIIEQDFDVEIKRFTIVRNGVELTDEQCIDKSVARDIDVLICGRIESRKNSVNIAKFFTGRPFKITFVGAINENDSSYATAFLNIIKSDDNLTYLGRVKPEQMPDIYRRSKIHLSASWFEVASLVDLESYAYGCHVISSENGHTDSYLGERATYCNPCVLNEMESRIGKLISEPNYEREQYRFIVDNFTWRNSYEQLITGLNESNR